VTTTLADKLELPGLVASRRPAHAVVIVEGRVDTALKLLRKFMDTEGTLAGFRRDGPRVAAETNSERRRRKRRQALARARRARAKRLRWEARNPND